MRWPLTASSGVKQNICTCCELTTFQVDDCHPGSLASQATGIAASLAIIGGVDVRPRLGGDVALEEGVLGEGCHSGCKLFLNILLLRLFTYFWRIHSQDQPVYVICV